MFSYIRCSLRPKKKILNGSNLEENIKEYYLDKNIKRKPNNLETIYEENDDTNDNPKYMSTKRFKRMLLFTEPTASKLRKRRAKIQKIFGSKVTKGYNKRRISMQSILDKLDGIRTNSPAEVDIK